MWSLVVLVVAAASRLSDAYPFEVANAACVDMTPKGPVHQHGVYQNTSVPYAFALDKKAIKPSDSVEFTISQKPGGKPFAAFMVQVRSGKSEMPLGTFQPKGDNAKTITCTSENDTGSHNSPDPKDSVTLIWTPPTNFKGTATFYVTVAETKIKYWAKKKAGTVKVL